MDLNKENIKKIGLLIAFGVALYVGLQHLNELKNFGGWILGLVTPFVLGASIAFILNCPMRFLERVLFSEKRFAKKKKLHAFLQKIKRPASMLLTFVLVIAILFVVIFLVVPEIGRTIDIIASSLPGFFAKIEALLTDLAAKYPQIFNEIANIQLDWRSFDWEKIGKMVGEFLQSSGNLVSSTFGVASSIFSGFFNFFLGIIFSIYLLLQKEKLGRQFRQVLYAHISEKRADQTLRVLRLSNETFSNFISGQCLEAVILGVLFFVTMSIFQFPYALMVSVLIGCLALIPIFGAFIGCAIGTFLILIVNPMQAIWFLVLYLVIQQVEGNLIYPYVVGNSVGLPSIWVLVAVTLGGNLMGIVGMLIFIPLVSVLYALGRESVFRKLRIKKLPKNKIS